ncbi:phosphatidylethanolamine-binding protein [Diplogelasinospora grovesii]|uniref:Large ribosomal subunit protein mL38 n=1 Tax=Diplogelasinospora grovesii TaxID=303347 RepID=A0AAN6NFY1_9PEZI|nr:phosphatidylethanolamine-binding protein [Diplogelasinospora grovesii]
MSRCQPVSRPLIRSLQQSHTSASLPSIAIRSFSSTPARKDEPTTTTQSSGSDVSKIEEALLGARIENPFDGSLGSRRRRAALATTTNIPFEQMPYQTFQEARKILNADRQEKIAQIVKETAKIKRLEAADASTMRGGEAYKQKRLASLREYVEELKILADINDPLVKRRFEDGMGDMNKPIYRYLAENRWRGMDYKIITQRIEQFNVVPDILPKFDPTMDVQLSFRGSKAAPGTILDSRLTETPPTLRMQVFDAGERLLSVVVMDADVPDPMSDGFKRRCHFLAANIPWDPTKKTLSLHRFGATPTGAAPTPSTSEGDLAVPWLPAFAQKGSPYHRMNVFVLEQSGPLDTAKLKELYDGAGRDSFSIKSFRDKFNARPVGFNLFRSVWDEGTAGVMQRHGIPGADVEFKRQRVYSLKTPRKAKGWEAKRQKPKYKHLWKYTKRIGTMSGGT